MSCYMYFKETSPFLIFLRFLTYDPGKKKRITAEDALKHAYFSVSAYLFHNIDYTLVDSI